MENNNLKPVETDEYFEELIGKYIDYKAQEKYFKELSTEMSNEVDRLLHTINVNSKKVYISAIDKLYEAKYIDRVTKKVDYVKLSEILSDELYDSVVVENTSTYLQIRAAAATKSKSRKKPVDEAENKMTIPSGTLN